MFVSLQIHIATLWQDSKCLSFVVGLHSWKCESWSCDVQTQDLIAKMWLGELKNTQKTILKLVINEHETFVLVFVGITLMFLADSCQGDRKIVEGETEVLLKTYVIVDCFVFFCLSLYTFLYAATTPCISCLNFRHLSVKGQPQRND
jgi:hypothetical protein